MLTVILSVVVGFESQLYVGGEFNSLTTIPEKYVVSMSVTPNTDGYIGITRRKESSDVDLDLFLNWPPSHSSYSIQRATMETSETGITFGLRHRIRSLSRGKLNASLTWAWRNKVSFAFQDLYIYCSSPYQSRTEMSRTKGVISQSEFHLGLMFGFRVLGFDATVEISGPVWVLSYSDFDSDSSTVYNYLNLTKNRQLTFNFNAFKLNQLTMWVFVKVI